jgi:hypothetical protein
LLDPVGPAMREKMSTFSFQVGYFSSTISGILMYDAARVSKSNKKPSGAALYWVPNRSMIAWIVTGREGKLSF